MCDVLLDMCYLDLFFDCCWEMVMVLKIVGFSVCFEIVVL